MASSRPEHTLIVGAGIIGICCAYYLARRGHRVTVVEAEDLAARASQGNAGSIAPGHEPINKPGRTLQALRWMFSSKSPLYVAPRPDPALARWLWTFRRYCTEAHLHRAMTLLGPLGHRSAELFEALRDEQLACHYRTGGYYAVFRTEAGLRHARADAALLPALGYRPECFDAAAMRDREPALGEVAGGVFYPESSWCDPELFVRNLAAAVVRHGGELHTHRRANRLAMCNERVTGVHTDGGMIAADLVLLATGAQTPELLQPTRLRLPLQPAKGYHRDYAHGPGVPRLHAPCILGESYVFCTPLPNRLRLAGTLEFSGFNLHVRHERLEQLSAAAREYYRDVHLPAPASEWVGQRPCLPDGLPAVGPVRQHPGLAVATGHAMMGLTLGPVTGELVANMVLGEPLRVDVGALDPNRF
ncbi:MAG: FAD-dependent oxidoreductase [Myxococcales bacterium FL481]|nr:MAG: FAD-dependent oxidoreductase [Myxococcales bacterium FL481]